MVVVDTPTELALERLLSQRGFDRADAEARIGAQIDREERVEGADCVLDNSGRPGPARRPRSTGLWDWLLGPAAPGPPAAGTPTPAVTRR